MITINKNPESLDKFKVGSSTATPADGEVIAGVLKAKNDSSHATVEVDSGSTSSNSDSNFNLSGTRKGIIRYDHNASDSSGKFQIFSGGNTSTARVVINGDGNVSLEGSNDVKLTLSDQGTPHTNDSNFVRGRGATGLQFNSAVGGYAFEIAGTEKVGISSTGLCTFSNGIAVNDTSGNYGGKIASSSDASGTASLSAVNKATSGTRRLIDFFAGTNTSRIGSIETDGSATTFNTSSDYRLKENLEPLTGALDRIEQLPVYRFNFKADPEKTVDGFVAHEISEFVPEAISGTKDAMQTVVVKEAVEAKPATYWEEDDELPEGVEVGDEKTPAIEAQEEVTEERPDYQGIDQSKLVPLLVAAVKELKAKVEALVEEPTEGE